MTDSMYLMAVGFMIVTPLTLLAWVSGKRRGYSDALADLEREWRMRNRGQG